MFRYLSFIWNRRSAVENATARILQDRLLGAAWARVIGYPGTAVYCAGQRPGSSQSYCLHNKGGAIVGAVFRRGRFKVRKETEDTIASHAIFDDPETRALLHSGGRALVENYWGRYVAFLVDGTGCIRVIRDPTGGLPCFFTTHHDVTIVFSELKDCQSIGVDRSQVNWDYITARVAVPWRMESRETGLHNVSSLAAGECLERAPDGRERRYLMWNPHEVVSRDPIEDVNRATQELRDAVRTCVHTWASCYSGILHALSGGFDSSVVLSCLADAPSKPRVTCQTYYSDGTNDERRYARLAAQHVNCNLVEMMWSEEIDLRSMQDVIRAPFPTQYLQWLELSHRDARLASQLGAKAIFGGQGGDQVFFQRRPDLAVADYLRLKGPFFVGALPLAIRVAYSQDLSVWRVLRKAARYGLGNKALEPRQEAYEYRKLVCDDVLSHIRRDHRFDHPWLNASRHLPPAKIDQVYYLADPPEFYDPFHTPDHPERVFPLWCQPIIETCLRIPSYVLTFDGNDRSIARKAFSEDIPPEITRRYAKGRIDEHIKQIFLRNLEFIREVVLDGSLIARGILNRQKVEQALVARPSAVGSGSLEIFDVLSIEIWLQGRPSS